MSKQAEIFIKGRVGNLILYNRLGVYCSRAVPHKVKRTSIAKLASANFSIAASTGKYLRKALLPVIPFPRDRSMQMRLHGAVAKWLGTKTLDELEAINDIPKLNHFDFNPATSFTERFKAGMSIESGADGLVIHIPAFIANEQIKAPVNTTRVILKVSAAWLPFPKVTEPDSRHFSFDIPFTQERFPEQTLSLPFTLQKGYLFTAAASLQFIRPGRNRPLDAAFIPASMVDARFGG